MQATQPPAQTLSPAALAIVLAKRTEVKREAEAKERLARDAV